MATTDDELRARLNNEWHLEMDDVYKGDVHVATVTFVGKKIIEEALEVLNTVEMSVKLKVMKDRVEERLLRYAEDS